MIQGLKQRRVTGRQILLIWQAANAFGCRDPFEVIQQISANVKNRVLLIHLNARVAMQRMIAHPVFMQGGSRGLKH